MAYPAGENPSAIAYTGFDLSAPPLLSVFMPTYNGARFVREAIESVLDNGFSDFELVVVDDASTDDTAGIVQTIRHPALRLVRNPVNLGVAAIRRQGVSLLRGQYMGLLDQDDIAAPGRFAAQINRLEQAGGPDIIGGAVECFGDVETVVRFPLADAEITAGLLFISLPLANPAVCLRLSPFRHGRIDYSVEAGPAADYALWVDALRAGLRFENLPMVVTRYRRHGGSLSQQDSQNIVTLSSHFRREIVGIFFPAMPPTEQAALVDALSCLIGGGQHWVEAVYAISHAAMLAHQVPRIEPGYLVAQLRLHLLRMIRHVIRLKSIDFETLEMMTEVNAHFETWRRADGGALDRDIMAIVMAAA